jgi:hypothetical protein
LEKNNLENNDLGIFLNGKNILKKYESDME